MNHIIHVSIFFGIIFSKLISFSQSDFILIANHDYYQEKIEVKDSTLVTLKTNEGLRYTGAIFVLNEQQVRIENDTVNINDFSVLNIVGYKRYQNGIKAKKIGIGIAAAGAIAIITGLIYDRVKGGYLDFTGPGIVAGGIGGMIIGGTVYGAGTYVTKHKKKCKRSIGWKFNIQRK